MRDERREMREERREKREERREKIEYLMTLSTHSGDAPTSRRPLMRHHDKVTSLREDADSSVSRVSFTEVDLVSLDVKPFLHGSDFAIAHISV